MTQSSASTTSERIQALQEQVATLRAKLAKLTETPPTKDAVAIRVTKSSKHFKRIKNPDGPDTALGSFFLSISITAVADIVYLPLSVASGKKPAGFVYQIEGTKEAEIGSASVSSRGTKVTEVTVGTLRYAKIPKGATATFSVLIEMKGLMQNSYSITITRINYKHSPNDTRYTRYEKEITSGVLKMS